MSGLPFAKDLDIIITSVARKSTTTTMTSTSSSKQQGNESEKLVRRHAAIAKDKISNLGSNDRTRTSATNNTSSVNNVTESMPNMEFRRKTRKKLPLGALYDEKGILINSSINLCDCLQKNCSGCFFPCPRCKSQKCGLECRVYRKFIYAEIEYHGYDFVVKNGVK